MATKPVNSSGVPTPMMPATAGEAAKTKGATPAAVPAAGGAATPKTGAGPRGNYDVQISGGGKDRAEAYQKALDIAKNTPDVREDRVAALKKQIADGTYQIDTGKIADGMLREAVIEHLAQSDER